MSPAFLTLFSHFYIVVQWLSPVQLFGTPWTAASHASLSFTISWSLLKFMSIGLVILSNHLILCRPLLLLPSVFPSIRVCHLCICQTKCPLTEEWTYTCTHAQACVYAHSGILLSHEKEQTCTICRDVGEPRGCHTE